MYNALKKIKAVEIKWGANGNSVGDRCMQCVNHMHDKTIRWVSECWIGG